MEMKLTPSFLFAALLIASPRLDARPFTLYVATNGNDQWSGQLASPASNAQDGPLATLPAALKAARQAREKNSAQGLDGVTIFLRGGQYALSAPVRFTPDDSGASAKAPLVIAAYENEKPVLSGGRSLTGWKRVEGKASLWQTEVPDVRDGSWYFRTLFINGQRKQRARTPSEGFFRIDGASPQDKPVKLKFKPGDIKKEWAEAGDVEVIALLAWADIRMFIRSVDETNHVATLSTDPRPSNKENNARYFIENAPDGLDAPGEWYLNRRTGVVSYWAPPGEDLTTAEVVAGHLDDLVVFEGDLSAKKPMEHVILRGLTFSYTDWPMPANGYTDTQAAIAVRGDVRAEAAIDCVVENCTFTHLSGYALMHDIGQSILSDMGAVYTLGIQKGTVIRNNLIHDVNAFTYGGWGLYPDEGSTEIVWENNVVYRCKSAGFHQHYGRDNIVRNNVFAFNRENQLMRTREEQHTSFIFTNNIVYFDAGHLLGSNWKNDHFRMGGNVYFDTRVGTNCEVMKFGNASWEQWRARGHDASSVVADPLFVAPDKFDFRLKAESPAIKLGFKPIDLSQVGVRKQNSN